MAQNCINNRVMTWSAMDATQVALFPNNGYIDLNSNGNIVARFSLPTTCLVGDRITLINNSSQSSYITQSDGQQIFYGDIYNQTASSTFSGSSGFLEIEKLYCVTLICVVANLSFIVESYTGRLIPRVA